MSTALKSSHVSSSGSIESRREQIALAKLNVEHLKKKQELERKLTELKVIPQYCIAHPYCARFLRH